MKLFNKSNKKNNETHRLPMGNKSKRALRRLCGFGADVWLLYHHGLCRQRPADGHQQPQSNSSSV